MGVDENGSFESPLPCHLDRSMTAFGHAKWRDLQFAWSGNAAPGKLQVLTQSAPQTFCIALCNIQGSPLRRQKTPPPVEMTRYGWVRKELQLKVARRSLFSLLFFWLSFPQGICFCFSVCHSERSERTCCLPFFASTTQKRIAHHWKDA